tara:strand:+ start:256 stop:435 length:180 start_codon:yes stop_codon:yes gene_type:complete
MAVLRSIDMAKLRDAGIYVPKENEKATVGMVTTNNVPERMIEAMKETEKKSMKSGKNEG